VAEIRGLHPDESWRSVGCSPHEGLVSGILLPETTIFHGKKTRKKKFSLDFPNKTRLFVSQKTPRHAMTRAVR